ncbi:MAG: YebC/PmpR family DNA-binding transcriptional regulator [bacterium]|nr:YebC/PmpR family DNA-binding transcriptional regulator [bacterium]
MSGHNKWSQIKNQKGVADKKRGALFGKLLKAISIAAKTESNPPALNGRGSPSNTGRQSNPRLRSAIEKAKENSVPQENIERALSKASEEKDLTDVIIEAYGPGGAALIIEGVTDNSNRAINEVKKLLGEYGGKIATPGSVLWSFEKNESGWKAKFPLTITDAERATILKLQEALEELDDIQKVISNIL